MNKILVTGGAGFIGSNLIGKLLELKYEVVCLDNLATGNLKNIQDFENDSRFTFIEGDILDFEILDELMSDCKVVLHQAALGSVPRSIKDPITSNNVNVGGTLNVFQAAVKHKVDRVVYAASSSTYGDSKLLPKQEDVIGKPLSPYAVTKLVNEIYADVFNKVYGLNTIGLRYFNVFGPKQNPKGPYAAVIPLFIQSLLSDKKVTINGDGLQSRDFTFVDNVVQANINAINSDEFACNKVYNIACGDRTTLIDLYRVLSGLLDKQIEPNFGPDREGDVKHSLADISRAKKFLGYEPKFKVKDGLALTLNWYKQMS